MQVLEPVLERLDAIIDGLSGAEVAVIERFLGQIIDFYVAELQRPLGTPTFQQSPPPSQWKGVVPWLKEPFSFAVPASRGRRSRSG